MADPFLSEIKIMAFNFAPKGWALCNGQLMPINQNQALFSLLGTTYGGNGQTNFALPNLQGRAPMHVGNGSILGQSAGEEAHTLSGAELPAHSHVVSASTDPASAAAPSGSVGYARSGTSAYASPGAPVAMAAQTSSSAGGSQPHPNMAPYLTLNFCIALQGIYPSRN